VLHFSLVIAFANPWSSSIPPIAMRYAYPFFQQSWEMFVPAPSSNYKLFVEYECNGIQKYDLFEEVNTAHHQNRLKGYEPLMLLFSNSIHYFEYSTPLQEKLNGPMRNDLHFTMIEHSALNYVRKKHDCQIPRIKMVLYISGPATGQRVYFN
jgi:hypothetical protein